MQIGSRDCAVMTTLVVSMLCACGARHEATENYVLVASNTKIAYWQEAARGLEAAAGEFQVKSEMVGPETYDPKAERQQFLEVVHRQKPPSGILVSPADPSLLADAIDSAIAAGIPVITIDSDAPKSKRLVFVGTNNYEAGQMGGETLVKEMHAKGNIAVLTIPGQENLDERLEGYKRVLARNPEMKIVQVIDMAGDPNKAFDGTRQLIESKKIPDGFVCLEALSCSEVAEVLNRAGLHKTIIAMDTMEGTVNWIQKGMVQATIAQKPYTMANFGLRVLDSFHHNKPANTDAASNRSSLPAFIDTGATLVDKSSPQLRSPR
jgi:ribose transport system substrate-binding protein